MFCVSCVEVELLDVKLKENHPRDSPGGSYSKALHYNNYVAGQTVPVPKSVVLVPEKPVLSTQ